VRSVKPPCPRGAAIFLAAVTLWGCPKAPDPAPDVAQPDGAGADNGEAPTPTETSRPFPPPDGSTPIVDVRGSSLELNPDDNMLSAALWRDAVWEEKQTELLLAQLEPGDTFVDVGANLGYYTVLAAKKVGATGRVFAFEPDPESFALLKRNVARNGLDQVVLENKAAGATHGTLRLFLSTANRGDHRVYDPGGGRTSVEVEVVALDAYLAAAGGNVDFAKIDTRGAECAVLEGMKTTIATQPQLALSLAYYPRFVEAMGYTPSVCFGALADQGFKLEWIDDDAGTVASVETAALSPTQDGALLLRARGPS